MGLEIITRNIAKLGGLVLPGSVARLSGSGAPTDGVTGAKLAAKGSSHIDYASGMEYVNVGTRTSPVWLHQLFTTEVAISSANIVGTSAGQLGHAQGVPLVAAPGTGKALEFCGAVVIYDYAGAGYGAGGNVTVNWAAGGAAVSSYVSAANSLGAGADKIVNLLPLELATAGAPLVANAALHLVAASAFTLGSATGVVRVKVSFRVHTTGL